MKIEDIKNLNNYVFFAEKLKSKISQLAALSDEEIKLIALAIMKSKTLDNVIDTLALIDSHILIKNDKVFLSSQIIDELKKHDVIRLNLHNNINTSKLSFSAPELNDLIKSGTILPPIDDTIVLIDSHFNKLSDVGITKDVIDECLGNLD